MSRCDRIDVVRKDVLLRGLLLGLVLTHPPSVLNVVLVDYKGGATFAGMAGLPHVSALITNLADETAAVDLSVQLSSQGLCRAIRRVTECMAARGAWSALRLTRLSA